MREKKKTSASKASAAESPDKYQISSVSRTMAALEFLFRADHPVTAAELTKASGMKPTSSYRMLHSLLKCGWLRTDARHTFRLAAEKVLEMLPCNSLYRVINGVQPVLDELAEKTRLSCKLSLRDGEFQTVALRAEPPDAFAVSAGRVGAHFPVIEGSVGAALLLGVDKNEIYRLARRCKEDIPEKRKASVIYERIAQLDTHGYIFNQDNNRWRVAALSVPVRGRKGDVPMALTLLGIGSDINPDNIDSAAADLAWAAQKTEEVLQQ